MQTGFDRIHTAPARPSIALFTPAQIKAIQAYKAVKAPEMEYLDRKKAASKANATE